ncbi:MAG: ectonucleotide pyrophosphatase/phosphodiesterase [Caulobacteraceae bacterium]
MKPRALCWLAGLIIVFACAGAGAGAPRPPLVVVSIDGFRADYLDRSLTPNLAAIGREGVRAVAMRPAFPTLTEPNHYTLMTGLYPDIHGIVDNTMIDRKMPGMAFGAPHHHADDMDPRWWNEATPLWVTAERHHLKTATSLWPDDDAVIHGVSPTYRQSLPAGGGSVSMDQQVDTVLGWLDLPPSQRPALIRVNFDVVDLMGRVAGPDSRRVDVAIGQADAAIGRLVQGLKARGLYDKVNLVIVSDHGMAAISPDRVIYLDDLIDLNFAVVPSVGAVAGIDPAPGHEAAIDAALLPRHDHMTCWRKDEIPARLHDGTNARVPRIVCLAQVGWSIVTRAQSALYSHLLGNDGYDPGEPTMAAIFLAHGPGFRPGVVLPVFDNIAVYPMFLGLMGFLGLNPRYSDENVTPLVPALRHP